MKRKHSLLLVLLMGTLIVHSQEIPAEKRNGYSLGSSEAFKDRIGKNFPEFKFTDLNGKVWRSESLHGKVVYLNFWFTGCPPCVQEIPSLNSAYAHFLGNPNVVMLSIDGFDSIEVVKKFLKTHPVDLPIATITAKEMLPLAGNKGTVGFPTHLLIDQDWRLAIAASGGNPNIGESITRDIETILQSKPAPPSNHNELLKSEK